MFYYSFIKVISLAFFPTWFFQGIEKMKYITIIDIFSKSLYTIAIFIFIDSESDYILVPLVSGAGYLIGTLLSLYYIFYRFKFFF